MPVLAIFSGAGISKAMYDALRNEIDWEHNHPAGGIFHAAGFDKSGAHVADVWASPEALDAFVSGRLMPAMTMLNVTPPGVQVFATHNISAYAAIDQFKV